MASTATQGVDVRRAGERARTRTGWLDSRHSFSFGRHYDQHNTHFGLLLVSNDDVVAAGTGFDTHPHRDMEIVTWVLDGALVHQDSTGHSGLIHPGLAQRMTAGSGILHSERNDRRPLDNTESGQPEPPVHKPVHFVQMWVLPDTDGLEPGYEQLDIGSALDTGDLVVVASGRPQHADERAITIRQRHAALHAGRLRPGGSVPVPSAPLAHLYVARGTADLEGVGALEAGDAARITGSDGQRIVAGPDGAEVLIWEMHATLA